MTHKRILPVAALGLLAAAAFAAPAAQADSGSCGLRTSSQAFAAWGDTADYWLMKGGDFESYGSYWSLAGGAVVNAGNEPFNLFKRGRSSLLLPSTTASASSSTTCVQVGEEAGRAVVQSPGVAGAFLHVDVAISLPTGVPVASFGADVDGSVAGWNPSPILRIPNLFATSTVMNVKLTFKPAGVSAPWRVDDVSVDPFRGG